MTDPRAAERCPPRGDLLCAMEGELTPEERLPLLTHLRRCPSCQTSVHDIDGFIELVATHIDISFDADRARVRFKDFLQRLHQQMQAQIHTASGWRAIPRWLPYAAVVPVVLVAVMLAWTQDVVKADELVTRAITAERAVPAGLVSRVRYAVIPANPALVRSTPAAGRLSPSVTIRDVTHGVVAVGSPAVQPVGIAPSDNDAVLAQLLAGTQFNLQEPFRMDAFQAWRTSPPSKQDHVTVSGSQLVLYTTMSEGVLREVHLTVRRDTFQVVGLALVFDGIGRVEFTEIEPPAPAPSRPEAPNVMASATGTAVAALPPATPRVATNPAPAARAAEPRAAARPELSTWRARTFGDAAARTTFVPELERLVGSVKARLQALRDLAKRDDATSAPETSSDVSATRQQQVDDSYAALCADLDELNGAVSLLFGSRNRVLASEDTPGDWERRTNVALRHVEVLERSVEELLTHDDLPPKAFGPKSRHPVIVSFGALWDAISAADGQPSPR